MPASVHFDVLRDVDGEWTVIYKDQTGIWCRFQSHCIDKDTAETIARALNESGVRP